MLVNSQGHTVFFLFLYEWKGLTTRNIHVLVKYDSQISGSMSQGQNFGMNGKASSQGMYMWKMKVKPRKSMGNVKAFRYVGQRRRSRLRTRPDILVWTKRHHHKKCACVIWKLYPWLFKSYGKDNSFWDERTHRMTDGQMDEWDLMPPRFHESGGGGNESYPGGYVFC